MIFSILLSIIYAALIGRFLSCIGITFGSCIDSCIIKPLTRHHRKHIEGHGIIIRAAVGIAYHILTFKHLPVCREIILIRQAAVVGSSPVIRVSVSGCIVVGLYGIISQTELILIHGKGSRKDIMILHGDRRNRRSERLCLPCKRIIRKCF